MLCMFANLHRKEGSGFSRFVQVVINNCGNLATKGTLASCTLPFSSSFHGSVPVSSRRRSTEPRHGRCRASSRPGRILSFNSEYHQQSCFSPLDVQAAPLTNGVSLLFALVKHELLSDAHGVYLDRPP